MSVPSDPTVTTLVTSVMKEAGQYTVSSTQVADFITYQLQTIKTEIWSASKTDPTLEVETSTVATVGANYITLETDFDSEKEVWLYDAPSTYRGTAQAGTSTTITLASDFSSTTADMYGRLIFITGGTGVRHVRQCIDYNDTTKVVTVDSAWSVTPDSTSTYLIETYKYRLSRHERQVTSDFSGRPRFYAIIGPYMAVYPAGDQLYPIRYIFRSNLTRLDETSTTLIKHIRERAWLWNAGITYYTHKKFDDARVMQSQAVWQSALAKYGALTPVYEQMEINR